MLDEAKNYLNDTDMCIIKPSRDFKKLYKTVKKLGEGAFAEVFLAENKETGQQVACKIIDRSAMESPKHLWNELKIQHMLDHPHIVHLKEAFASNNHVVLVLEYAQGGELYDKLVEEDTYSEKTALDIISTLIDTLEYLHSNGVAHRDIKPENILFMDKSNESLKLSDFGLSGIMKQDSMLYTCAGTPGFMAPEVIKKTGYGTQCDMWGIGVLTYLLLSGQMPFNNPVPFKMYNSILNAEFEFTESFSEISEEAKDFITKCIIVDPKKRMTPHQAKVHPWLQTNNSQNLAFTRSRVVTYLEERRNLRFYRKTGLAISFISKLRAKSKERKKRALQAPENQEAVTAAPTTETPEQPKKE